MLDNNLDKIIELSEAIINEVSVGTWAKAANSSLAKRQQDAEFAQKQADFVKKNTSNDIKSYIKPENALTKSGTPKKKFKNTDYDYDAYQNAQNNVAKAQQYADQKKKRVEKASRVANLGLNPNSGVSTKTLLNAAKSVKDARHEENQKTTHSNTKAATRNLNRSLRANELNDADPNKYRKIKHDNDLKEGAKRLIRSTDIPRKNFIENDKKRELKDKQNKEFYNQDEYTAKADSLNNEYGNTKAQRQAHTDHQNAQINQGLRNKLEKTIKKDGQSPFESFSLDDKFSSILEFTTSIAGAFGVTPTPVVGQENPSKKYTKSSYGRTKPAMFKYKYKKSRSEEKPMNEEMELDRVAEEILESHMDLDRMAEAILESRRAPRTCFDPIIEAVEGILEAELDIPDFLKRYNEEKRREKENAKNAKKKDYEEKSLKNFEANARGAVASGPKVG